MAVLSAVFMSFVGILTETSLNVTFPTMMKQFNVALDTVQWTTTGYLLTIAIIMICSSYLNERFTAKQLFTVACVGFMVGSVISALVPNFLILLLGRLISALGAGISTPLMFNLVTEIIPHAKWGVYMGIAGLVVAMATTLEPAFGGITNFYLSWRWIFIFATIIALVVFIAVILVIGKYHEQVKINFDWLAFVVLAGVFITLTVGVNQISKGITNPLFWLLLVATAVLIWLFIKLSQRSTKKLLDLAVFKQNAFVWGALAYFLL
ncbi:Multi-drug-type permease [Lactobacillus helveticus CIRM-BIA 101]|nr:multi-drug-type permease [Lactobacillus helveticus DSM 20075 = CGMCC 1.1877]CDI66022.1 Multi-drug-type permease [Lactobacillus helveticus CIRM-BIA 101]